MKKTIITLLALAGVAMGDETTLTFSQTTNNNQAGYNGFIFTLSEDWLTPSDTNYEGSVYELASIDLTAAPTWYRLANSASGLVILEGDNFVGKSSWIASGDNYTFSNLQLDIDTEYKVLIYGNETAFNALTLGSTVTNLAGSQNPSETSPIVTAGLRVDYDANGTAGVMIGNTGAIDGKAFPVVTFSGKISPAIPEPTTATLSLLALAGLAARRRRK
ncbi:MAG: PEP-CTERM sorting domain-containing protein [bacterium]|nr:PEP-CTERM sorting domain-containing protein [bacterium]